MRSRVKKILIIDDAESVLLASGILLSRHYEVFTANHGVEGIEKARAERPDVIVLDLVMPGMDGLETCARLREDESTSRIPVILASIRAGSETLEVAMRAGFTDHVAKPIDHTALREKIEALTPSPGAVKPRPSA